MTLLVNKRINLQIATQSWLYIYHSGQYQTLICIISFLFSNEKRICKTFHKVALGIGGLYVYWYQIILHVFPILQLQCWFSLKKKILSFFSKSLRLQFKMFQHFLLLPISIMFMTLISDHQKKIIKLKNKFLFLWSRSDYDTNLAVLDDKLLSIDLSRDSS